MEDEAIETLLRRSRYQVTPAQTELFVHRVMATLPSPIVDTAAWLSQPWFIPTLGLALAALIVTFIPPPAPAEDSVALVLGSSEWSQPAVPSTADEVLGLVLESQ